MGTEPLFDSVADWKDVADLLADAVRSGSLPEAHRALAVYEWACHEWEVEHAE